MWNPHWLWNQYQKFINETIVATHHRLSEWIHRKRPKPFWVMSQISLSMTLTSRRNSTTKKIFRARLSYVFSGLTQVLVFNSRVLCLTKVFSPAVIPGPCLVAAWSPGGLLETPPRWQATILTGFPYTLRSTTPNRWSFRNKSWDVHKLCMSPDCKLAIHFVEKGIIC